MATLTNVITPVVNPSAAPTTNTISAAGDQFAAEWGAVYLMRWTNGSATPANVVMDDPNSSSPAAATAFNADVTIAVPAGESRSQRIDAARFMNSAGNIVWTYSADMTHANSKVEIYRVS